LSDTDFPEIQCGSHGWWHG